MSYYVIGEKFFYSLSDGIYRKTNTDGIWGDEKCIYNGGVRDFCVKTDANNILHIMCINKDGDIVYIKNGGVGHVLIKSKENVSAKKLMMYEYNHRISLVYTAEYDGDTLLIYCILGINSMPVTIDTIKSDNFFLYKNKVYYQNKDGFLGYKDFSDGRPDRFIPVADNSHSIYITEYNGIDAVCYKNEDGIVYNNKAVIEDKYAQMPIIAIRDAKPLIIWESGGFIRYAESDDGGESFKTPIKFFNNSSNLHIYKFQTGENFTYEYASERNREIKIFADKSDGKRDISNRRNMHINKNMESDKVMIMLEMLRKDVNEIKNRVDIIEKQIRKDKV